MGVHLKGLPQAMFDLGAANLPTYFYLANGFMPASHQTEILTAVQEFLNEAWSKPPHLHETLPVLNINLPPGAGKSTVCVKTLAPWILGNRPFERVGIISAKGDLASSFEQGALADITEGAAYERCFPHPNSRPEKNKWTKEGGYFLKGALPNQITPSLISSGLYGSILGKRLTVILIDDGQDQETSRTLKQREKTWEFIFNTVTTRGDPGCVIINIQQRLHDQDISGKLLDHMDAKSVSIPAIRKDPKTGEDVSYWPERFNLKFLLQRKAVDGDFFSAWFLQNPSGGEGTIFKREVLNTCYYTGKAPHGTLIQSWDTAFKKGEENDYTAMVEAVVTPELDIYITNMYWEKLDFLELIDRFMQFGRMSPNWVLVEDKASGTSAVQVLKAKSALPIMPYIPTEDKIFRAKSITGWLATGKVKIPKDHPRRVEFERFLTGFPLAKHDDPVDAMTQLIAHVIKDYDPHGNDFNIGFV